jgi:hypothetical protein
MRRVSLLRALVFSIGHRHWGLMRGLLFTFVMVLIMKRADLKRK